jgi:deaminated glutathione amidase
MRVACLQMCSGIDPAANTETIVRACQDAANGGAQLLTTPEMAVLLDRNRARARMQIVVEANSLPLQRVREAAKEAGIWLHIGSMALVSDDGDKWVNRAFLIAPDGSIAARYDKIHLFDVTLANGENWMESAAYAPGQQAVVVDTPLGRIGLAICYDVRFPLLFDRLGATRPGLILCPAAFTRTTGAAHWHVLTRARAIESSCFLIAAAQSGTHEDGRETYGHSIAVGPWGEVLMDMGDGAGLSFVDLDYTEISRVRGQVPGLSNRRDVQPLDMPPRGTLA